MHRNSVYRLCAFLSAIVTLVLLARVQPLQSRAFRNTGATYLSKVLVAPNDSFPNTSSKAGALLDRALQLDSQSARTVRLRGLLSYVAGDAYGAIQYFQRAVNLNPSDMLAHFALGSAYAALGQSEQAWAEWRVAGAAVKFRELGEQRFARQDWEGAIAAYQVAVDVAPTDWQAWRALGQALWWGRNDFSGALGAYQRLLVLLPRTAIPYLEIGNLYRQAKAWEEARAWYEQARQVEPHSVWPYLGIGRTYSGEARWTEAMEWYERAQAVSPEDAGAVEQAVCDTLVARGDQSRRVGQRVEALHSYLAALQYPACAATNWYVHAAAGQMYAQAGDWTRALPYFQEAARVDPTVYWPYLHIGDAYTALGRRDEAVAAYRRVLKLDPRNSRAIESLQRLLNP